MLERPRGAEFLRFVRACRAVNIYGSACMHRYKRLFTLANKCRPHFVADAKIIGENVDKCEPKTARRSFGVAGLQLRFSEVSYRYSVLHHL